MFNLPESAQEVVNRVCEGLASQNWIKSVDPITNRCAYRGSNGHRCAAGWLIPDEAYNYYMEGNDWTDVSDNAHNIHCKLISDLQIAHDCSFHNIPERIHHVIVEAGLQVPKVLLDRLSMDYSI